MLTSDRHLWTTPPQAGGPRYLDEVASAFQGAPAECGPFYKWERPRGYQGRPPSSADAAGALKSPVIEVCPVCHYRLPHRWREGHATCIALAGARATGKSLYIAVVVKQLELLCENLGFSMEFVTRVGATAYSTHYEKPLLVQRGLLPPTPTVHTQTSLQREPLMISVGVWHGVRRYLVLRDVAGEDMETEDLRASPFRFFAHADAVFFMFDPLRVRSIRDHMQDLLPAQTFGGGDPRGVLSNVMRAIGRGQPLLAVILSKFDVLRALRDVEGSEWSLIMSNAGAAYLRDTSDTQRYDEAGGRLLHEEVRSLLMRLNAGGMVTAVENPSSGTKLRHRYFVVSSLGQPPSGNRLHSRGIAPFRCTDPVRWATSSFGVL